MDQKKGTFICLDDDNRYLGTFETRELARLYGVDKGGTENPSVIEPVRNYPVQDVVLLGSYVFNGNGQAGPATTAEPDEAPTQVEGITEAAEPTEAAPEGTTEETSPEPPKPKRARLSAERIQECCKMVVAEMTPGEPYKRAHFLNELGLQPNEWTKTIRILIDTNQLRQEGIKKGAVYFLVEGETEAPETEAPKTEASETEAEASETKAPETEASEETGTNGGLTLETENEDGTPYIPAPGEVLTVEDGPPDFSDVDPSLAQVASSMTEETSEEAPAGE